MSNSKILIVEDDQTLLSVLKYNLTKEGYTVVTAIDGTQAANTGDAGASRPGNHHGLQCSRSLSGKFSSHRGLGA